MNDQKSLGYTLRDPRPIAASAPYTFFLPSENNLAAVDVGDLVKLTFEYDVPSEKWGAERMWVIVKGTEGDHLWGILDNIPDEPNSPIKLGDEVRFSRHHILNIEWQEGKTPPDTSVKRDYWERCLVDECALEGEQPVEYIYREEPDMGCHEDKYPDSGWRIRGRRGDATDEDMESRKIEYVAIGAVLNTDDSWLHLIDAPVGSAFMRNFGTGEYVPETN